MMLACARHHDEPLLVGCSKFESKIRYKKWCYFGAAKLLIFNTLIYEIVL